MSQENIDTVIRGVRAAFARPEPDFAVLREVYAREHVFVPAGADMIEGEVRDAAGYRAWREETSDLLGATHELRGAVDVGPNTVLVVTTTRFEGSASGLTAEERLWSVVTLSQGKITRTEASRDPAEALEAVGLRE